MIKESEKKRSEFSAYKKDRVRLKLLFGYHFRDYRNAYDIVHIKRCWSPHEISQK